MKMDETGHVIANRYRLLERLGFGSMGAVYRAVDRLDGETVALKRVLMPVQELTFTTRNTASTTDPRIELAHEFQTLASLRHPNIVAVKDYGFDAGTFFTMNLIESPLTFQTALLSQPLSIKIDAALQLLQGLAYIHRRNLLHRDLKPTNVLVKEGHVYIVDFGLALTYQGAVPQEQIAGTLAYMAPEVLSHQAINQTSDLYAFGLMLYEVIAGKHPYETNNPLELINKVLNEPIDVARLDVSGELQMVFHRLLAKDPDERYPDADAVIAALTQASGRALPQETIDIRENFLQAAAFIGRESELRQLRASLHKLGEEMIGSAWLIGGESGIGKSRLIEEVATRALVANMRVLRGQATTEGGLRYDLWRDAVTRLLLHIDLSDTEAQAIKFIVPEIDSILDRETPPVLESGHVERLRLLIPAMFRRASERSIGGRVEHQPILLVLEDLQWAVDSVTDVALIRDVLALTAEIPLMLIGSYRDDERPSLPQTFPEMTSMKLDRLTTDEVAKLSRSMLGEAGKQREVVTFLHQQTEGNVFFLVEVVRALALDAGRIGDIGTVTLPAQIFASGVQRVVEHRLNRLPEWAQPLVEIAAVAGRLVDARLMQAVDSSLEIETWLALCTNLAVFEVVGENYRFAHDKIRETIITGLSDEKKRERHRQIASAIERAYGAEAIQVAAALTLHYGAAGDPAKEGYYAFHAGEQAYAVNLFPDADAYYRRAMTLRAFEQEENPRLAEGLIKLGIGRTAYALGDFELSRSWCWEATEMLREAGDELGYGEAINCIGEADFRQGFNDQAELHIREALAIRERLGTKRDVGYSKMNLGVIYAQRGQIEEAKTYFLDCYAAMRESGDDIALARALNNLAIAYELTGDVARGEATHRESLDIRRRINDRAGMATSLVNLSQLRAADGEPEVALGYVEEALVYLRQSGEKLAIGTALSLLSSVYEQLGQVERATQIQQEALSLRRQINDFAGISVSLNMLAQFAVAHKDYEIARAHLREGLAVIEGTQAFGRFVADLFGIVKLYQAEDRLEEAYALLDAVLPHRQRHYDAVTSIENLHPELKASLTVEQIARAEARFAGWTLEQLAAYFKTNA